MLDLYVWYYSPANSDSELENHHVAQLNLSMVQNMSKAIWRFPEMGVPPSHHPFFSRIFHERTVQPRTCLETSSAPQISAMVRWWH